MDKKIIKSTIEFFVSVLIGIVLIGLLGYFFIGRWSTNKKDTARRAYKRGLVQSQKQLSGKICYEKSNFKKMKTAFVKKCKESCPECKNADCPACPEDLSKDLKACNKNKQDLIAKIKEIMEKRGMICQDHPEGSYPKNPKGTYVSGVVRFKTGENILFCWSKKPGSSISKKDLEKVPQISSGTEPKGEISVLKEKVNKNADKIAKNRRDIAEVREDINEEAAKRRKLQKKLRREYATLKLVRQYHEKDKKTQ